MKKLTLIRKAKPVMTAILMAAAMLMSPVGTTTATAAMTDIDINAPALPSQEPQPAEQVQEDQPTTQTDTQTTEDRVREAVNAGSGTGQSTSGVAGFGDETGDSEGDQQQEDEDTSLPEWTEKITSGKGESSVGFSGSNSGNAGFSQEIMSYEGELDPVSRAPLNSDGTSTDPEQVISLSEKVSYDRAVGMFVFHSTRYDAEIRSDMADGMITRDVVRIDIPEGIPYTLYRNGEVVEEPNMAKIYEPGSYVVRLGRDNDVEDLFSFTIITALTGSVNYYDMPDGFQVDRVCIDGVQINNNRTRAELVLEGEYDIDYSCPKAGISYSLRVTIDHTPPEVIFIGVDESGTARGPVTWEGLKEGESLSFLKDGKEFKNGSGKLTQTGQYVITATDQAGNESEYYITILLYLNAQSVVFMALFVAIIAAVLIYLHFEKARLRVR
ncbi:MAG: hypothetical protein K6E84_09305 [Lachnospiraceae bacterium]|nr:hypothetical protein [Lachnospiraceae bacterium]